MKRPIFALLPLLLLLIPLSVSAQVSSTTARSIRSGANLPATCAPGPSVTNVFIKTGASAGVYYCSATNTWTAVGAGAGSFTTLTTSGTSVLASPVTIGVGQTTSATTDLLINPSVKASGNLIAGQVSSVALFGVDFSGATTVTGFLKFGATSAFPSIKRNGTAINFRLADDSADAPITALTGTFANGATFGSATSAFDTSGSLTLGAGRVLQTPTGNVNAQTYSTNTNCADSAGAAACGSASAGAFVLDAAATTVTVSSTSVTANSEIFIQETPALNTRLSITCNVVTGRLYTVTTITAGTSFVVTASAAPAATPACLQFRVVN